MYVPPMMGDSIQGYLPIKADNAPYLSVIVKPRHNVEATSGRFIVASTEMIQCMQSWTGYKCDTNPLAQARSVTWRGCCMWWQRRLAT